jgi:hypothetical protein
VNTHSERQGDWYEIRVQGRLDARWSTWLDGLTLSQTDDGITVLRGPVTDQAALHGLLNRVRDIGLPLLAVARTDPDRAVQPQPAPTRPSTPHDRRIR